MTNKQVEEKCNHKWRQVLTDDDEALLNCEICGIIEEIKQEEIPQFKGTNEQLDNLLTPNRE